MNAYLYIHVPCSLFTHKRFHLIVLSNQRPSKCLALSLWLYTTNTDSAVSYPPQIHDSAVSFPAWILTLRCPAQLLTLIPQSQADCRVRLRRVINLKLTYKSFIHSVIPTRSLTPWYPAHSGVWLLSILLTTKFWLLSVTHTTKSDFGGVLLTAESVSTVWITKKKFVRIRISRRNQNHVRNQFSLFIRAQCGFKIWRKKLRLTMSTFDTIKRNLHDASCWIRIYFNRG